jgi:hypothetical protein
MKNPAGPPVVLLLMPPTELVHDITNLGSPLWFIDNGELKVDAELPMPMLPLLLTFTCALAERAVTPKTIAKRMFFFMFFLFIMV